MGIVYANADFVADYCLQYYSQRLLFSGHLSNSIIATERQMLHHEFDPCYYYSVHLFDWPMFLQRCSLFYARFFRRSIV